MKRLRVPAVLIFGMVGCDGGSTAVHDAAIRDANANCQVLCIPDGTDAGVCPSSPYDCVSAARTCPAGCMCTAYCFPHTPQDEPKCPTSNGLQCASPERTCPDGCDPVA